MESPGFSFVKTQPGRIDLEWFPAGFYLVSRKIPVGITNRNRPVDLFGLGYPGKSLDDISVSRYDS
jgi:hypothetical protein